MSKYVTSFTEGMTITGGKTVNIPLGTADNRGNLVIDDTTSITVDGNPAVNIKRSTTRNYFFTDRPNEDVIGLCEAYLQKLQEMVMECHEKFRLP